MSKIGKFVLYFLVFAAVVVGAFFGLKAIRGGGDVLAAYPWITIDENYAPRNPVEEFIKNDAQLRGSLPVEIRNFDHEAKILKKFRGRQFAQPTENVLLLFFKGLDDWMLVDLKYQNEKKQEVRRTILYVFENKQWKVGDTGTLMK